MPTVTKTKHHRKRNLLPALLLLLIFLASQLISTAHAAPPCAQWSGKILSMQGAVEISRKGESSWSAVSSQEVFCPGDRLRVAKNSRAAILLPNNTLIRLAEGSALTFVKQDKKNHFWLDMLKGIIHFISRTPRSLTIKTPFVNASIDGTEFVLSVEPDQTKIWVFEGQVSAVNPQGRLVLNRGESAVAEKGRAPVRKLVVTPRDFVQWALYYPPVIDYRAKNYTIGPDAPMLGKSLELYRRNDLPGALACLDAVPQNLRTARYYDLRAGLFLTVGKVAAARSDIDQALRLNPCDGTAYGLKSVIAVTQNKTKESLTLARKSVQLSPQSPVSYIALSYAHQARFDIEKAKQSAEQAVSLASQNALAWARLAELELSLGNIDRAIAAAQKAVEYHPDQAWTQTILGFANLTEIEIDKAKTAFEKAIEFDPADPLPRLGLGLAKIRQGNLDEGTKQIETAAILDSDNSLIRSYLGKAYYEQKRSGLARTEFAIAKVLDPNDPTPWFYDALLKQTENRPMDALKDMQKAIELNDNRAVYRSKLLLDQDVAARSVNLARIYKDIDFHRVSLNEAWKSLDMDWASFSAHRFLADAYLRVPRIRIARASELLQSQLLQPINITPIQPQLGGSDFVALSTLSSMHLSLNEFSPLYSRNGINWVLNGTAGSNDTWGSNLIISGIQDKTSGSMGQFHFQTDGFRKNDNFEQDILLGFAQYAINSKLDIQMALRDDETKTGDVASRINDFHKEHFRQHIDQETARIGIHFKPSTDRNLIFSGFYTRFEEQEHDMRPDPDFPLFLINKDDIDITSSGYQLETQYLLNTERMTWIAGLGYTDLNTDLYAITKIRMFNNQDLDLGLDLLTANEKNMYSKQFNGYMYSLAQLRANLTATLGFSFDMLDQGLMDVKQFNPKLGLQWMPHKDITIRTAVFRGIKRLLMMNQTIEPTQVAGFNQLFDDNNGARMWRYGVGLDYKPNQSLYGGFELSWRKTEQPVILDSALDYQDRDETAYLAYLYWMPYHLFSLSFEYRFEAFQRDAVNQVDLSYPRRLETHSMLLAANYRHPKGLFFNVSGTYVDQKAEFISDSSSINKVGDNFWIFDTTIGYRLPTRMGSIELAVNNVFNETIRYQSTFDASGPQLSPYKPEREFFLSVNLLF